MEEYYSKVCEQKAKKKEMFVFLTKQKAANGEIKAFYSKVGGTDFNVCPPPPLKVEARVFACLAFLQLD